MTVHSYQMIHLINITFLRTKIPLQTLRAKEVWSTSPGALLKALFVFSTAECCVQTDRSVRLSCFSPYQVHLVHSHSISVTLESFFSFFFPRGTKQNCLPSASQLPLGQAKAKLLKYSEMNVRGGRRGEHDQRDSEWKLWCLVLTLRGAVLPFILLWQWEIIVSWKVCWKIIPGCSSSLANVFFFFLVVVKLHSMYTISC